MSHTTRIRPYGFINDISGKDISLPEIAVYGYLCYRAGSSRSCYPTQHRIAVELHLSRDRVISAVKTLVAAGHITTHRIHAKEQRRYNLRYEIVKQPNEQKTYGRITERMLSVCAELSCGAIGLWFYATAVSGTRNDLYFNRAELARRLNISPRTLTKYINELVVKSEALVRREMIEGSQVTRFIVQSTCQKSTFSESTLTQGSHKLNDPSSPTQILPDKAKQTKINREYYLSLNDCATAQQACAKQELLRRELQAIYHFSDITGLQADVIYDGVATQLQRFARDGASKSEIMGIIKIDMRYLRPFTRLYPRTWIADPMIRSAALEVIFGVPKDDTTKTVISQLFWILGTAGDEQSRLLSHLDAIMSGKKNTQAWLSSLTNRAAKALKTRAILHPAAYVRRLILNWLSDRREQTVDLIDYHEEIDTTLNTASVPQTFEELVADTVCDRYRSQIRKLSRREYRDRANAYEAIVREREASGSPIERYDIGTDDEIVEIYAVMPESYYEVLHMIDVLDSEAILALPKQEIARRVFAYKRMSPLERASIFFDIETNWLLSPAIDDEAM